MIDRIHDRAKNHRIPSRLQLYQRASVVWSPTVPPQVEIDVPELLKRINQSNAHRDAIRPDMEIAETSIIVMSLLAVAQAGANTELRPIVVLASLAAGLVFLAGIGMAEYNKRAYSKPITPTGTRA